MLHEPKMLNRAYIKLYRKSYMNFKDIYLLYYLCKTSYWVFSFVVYLYLGSVFPFNKLNYFSNYTNISTVEGVEKVYL